MIIADTGFWVALLNRRDDFHDVAKASAARIDERLVTTLPVVTEVCHLLQTRVGQHRSVQFLQAHRDKLFQLFPIQDAERLARNSLKKKQ
ncbi:PIN domain-containing protein [uncultured Thiocystis sp.]|uniref:type II toxin-antitoxin system VapC family toxin n=1 Tax=uncultured Thiocystis sp. TaxID=1202134 RepID=UPI00260112A5|nr:PIN domain-containing protein [uncultured Thiocystis sp.]